MTPSESARKTINILHVRSCRGTGGGPEKTILFSAREVDRSSFTLHIAFLRSQDDPEFDLDQRARKLGIDNFVAIEERFKFDVRALRDLLKILREQQIDIMSCHCYKSDLYGLVLSRFHKMKVVSTAHGPLASLRHFWTAQNWRVRYVYDKLDLMLLRYFDHVMLVSDSLRAIVSSYGVKDSKLTWVRNAIDANFFRKTGDRSLRDRLNLPPDAVVIGAVGRLNAEKDYPNFLEAARILLAERQDLYFTIAGGGPLETTIREQVQSMGLAGRVLFLGNLHDIRQAYEAMDVYVLSSTREGLPNTILEAMAMEVPIVATDVDGVGEAVIHDRDALLVPPRDARRLADGVLAILTNPSLAERLRRSAREKIEREFSFSSRMRRVENIYRGVLGMATSGASR